MFREKGEVTIQNIVWIAVGVVLIGLIAAVVYKNWPSIERWLDCLLSDAGTC